MLNFRNCSGSRKIQQLREPIGDSSVNEEVPLDLWPLDDMPTDGRQTGLGLNDSKVQEGWGTPEKVGPGGEGNWRGR